MGRAALGRKAATAGLGARLPLAEKDDSAAAS